MHSQGKSIDEISKKTGYAPATVRVYIGQSKKTGEKRRFVEQYAKEIMEMHKNGHRTKDIAEKVGLSYTTVNNFLTKKGLRDSKSRIRSQEEPQVIAPILAKPKKICNEKIRDGKKIYTDITMQYAGW